MKQYLLADGKVLVNPIVIASFAASEQLSSWFSYARLDLSEYVGSSRNLISVF